MKNSLTLLFLGVLISGFPNRVAAQSSLTISPTTLPEGTANVQYSVTLTPNGGSGSGYQFTIASGASSLSSLGLSLSTLGVLSGTPTAGTASFTVQLTDSLNNSFSQAYTLEVNTVAPLHNFAGESDGNSPTMLIQAMDGSFYGITSNGGGSANCPGGCGTIFKLVNNGNGLTEAMPPLHIFSGGADGEYPSSLIQAPGGKIFVSTLLGGPDNSELDICEATDGSQNAAPCCLDSNGNAITCGGIFEFDPMQSAPVTMNPIHTFSGGTDGASPGTLILGSTASDPHLILGTTLACSNCGGQDADGETIDSAGYNIYGTVFSFVPSASTPVTPTTIVSFPFNQNPAGNIFTLAYPNALIQWDQNTLFGTTQMGGDSDSQICPWNSNGGFGCGGVFQVDISEGSISELCDFGGLSGCAAAGSAQSATSPATNRAFRKPSPQKTVIRQSGVRFPVGGNTWNFTTYPIGLVIDSNEDIYGTTPFACFDSSGYLADSNCPSLEADLNPYAEMSAIFEFTPPSGSSGSTGTMDSLLYPFSGNNPASSPPPTPGGTLAGLTLATDDNLYGLSGDGSTLSEVFTVQGNGITQFAQLDPSYTPTWMIQGSDGNFYGASPAGGTSGYGAVFEVAPATPMPAPVQLSFQPSQINLGSSATLTWSVPNAFSLSSQQCFPYVQSGQSGAGTWSKSQTGSVSSGVYRNSASITPTAPGTFNYAVSCGGVISGFVSLQVILSPLAISPATLPAATAETPYSAMLMPSGGSTTGYHFAISSGAASLTSLGLSLSSNGLISGTPTAGTATFTVQLTDSLGDSFSQAFTLIVNQATPTINWPPPAAITYGTPLSAAELDAAASFNGNAVMGAFTYNPPTGTILAVGTQTLSATFTPKDTTDFTSATGQVTLTVNPAPGFSLSPSPAAVSVPQGGSATSTITVTSVGGFSGTVSLTTSGLPAGVNPSINPGTISGTQILTLTASTSAQVTSSPVTVTITGTSDTLTATTTISLSVTPQPSFTSGTGSTTSISVSPGATSGNTGTISVVGTNGFTGSINLTCAVTTLITSVSDMPTCSLSPLSVTISGTSPQTSTLTVSTTAPSSAENGVRKLLWRQGGLTVAIIMLFIVPGRRRRWLAAFCMLAAFLIVGAAGCGGSGNGGGGGGGGNPGTTAGAYTVTVTGTSGTTSATVGTVMLTVE